LSLSVAPQVYSSTVILKVEGLSRLRHIHA